MVLCAYILQRLPGNCVLRPQFCFLKFGLESQGSLPLRLHPLWNSFSRFCRLKFARLSDCRLLWPSKDVAAHCQEMTCLKNQYRNQETCGGLKCGSGRALKRNTEMLFDRIYVIWIFSDCMVLDQQDNNPQQCPLQIRTWCIHQTSPIGHDHFGWRRVTART